jgi:hypothetical protein
VKELFLELLARGSRAISSTNNQQKEGVHYKLGELYAPVMKAAEVRLFMAIAAKNGLKVFKSDTKQAFLNGEKGEELICIRAPDWWPKPVPEGHALMLTGMKSIYGTSQAASQLHVCISTCMEQHGYLAVNSEKTMFMKRKGKEGIMHGLPIIQNHALYCFSSPFTTLYSVRVVLPNTFVAGSGLATFRVWCS